MLIGVVPDLALRRRTCYEPLVSTHPDTQGSDPISKTYYDRKRAEGKRHNAAVICLARRRCNVIFAMLRNGTYYQPPTTNPSPESTALAA